MPGTDTEKGKYTTPNGSKTWEYLAILACSIMGLCMGTVVGWNSPSVVKLMSEDSPIPVTASDAASLVACVAIGHTIAPPINTMIVDRIGRKNSMLFSALPVIASWALITIADNVWMLYVARFLSGVSLGLSLCVSPMYVGEISSVKTRGAGGALLGIMYNIGILTAFVIAPYLSISKMAGICLVISISFVVVFWTMPDSPYFLAMKGRLEEAEVVLEKLRGRTDVSEELQAISASLSKGEKNDGKVKAKDVLGIRSNRRAFFIILLFAGSNHFGGFFTILTYGQLIFKTTASPISDHTANIMIGITQVISSVITTFLVDRLGRKPLIFVSGLVAGLCNLAIGLFFYAKDYLGADVTEYSLTPFVASIVLVFAFNCGLTSLQIIMMSEVFATEIKALSTCLIGVLGGILGTVACKLYILLSITWNYGHGPPFIGFFAILWIVTGLMLYITPETKGKTFVEIQRKLNR